MIAVMAGWVAAALSALLFLCAGCGENEVEPVRARCDGLDTASIDFRYPDTSFRDWKSYADHLVTYKILTKPERRGEASWDLEARIEHIHWSAPAAPKPPRTWRIVRAIFAAHDEPEMRFLSPLVSTV